MPAEPRNSVLRGLSSCRTTVFDAPRIQCHHNKDDTACDGERSNLEVGGPVCREERSVHDVLLAQDALFRSGAGKKTQIIHLRDFPLRFGPEQARRGGRGART